MPQILDQLMPLPKREQDGLARLLVRTPMSKLIEANTILTNRLDFLAVLREMVFDTETSKRVKERRELHKILEKELWVFGDEYALLAIGILKRPSNTTPVRSTRPTTSTVPTNR